MHQPSHHLLANIKWFAQFLALGKFPPFCEIESSLTDQCLVLGLWQQAFIGLCVCSWVFDVQENAEIEVLPWHVSDSRYFHWCPRHNYDLPINKSYKFAYSLCLCRRSHWRQLIQMRWAHVE